MIETACWWSFLALGRKNVPLVVLDEYSFLVKTTSELIPGFPIAEICRFEAFKDRDGSIDRLYYCLHRFTGLVESQADVAVQIIARAR